mmetsp:Transcript_25807/g.79380  ORF Transcript_25807/g.79380 Transcript_25807/m.79380 type:complete len:262 (+) Transcript_25807:188-973(+)
MTPDNRAGGEEEARPAHGRTEPDLSASEDERHGGQQKRRRRRREEENHRREQQKTHTNTEMRTEEKNSGGAVFVGAVAEFGCAGHGFAFGYLEDFAHGGDVAFLGGLFVGAGVFFGEALAPEVLGDDDFDFLVGGAGGLGVFLGLGLAFFLADLQLLVGGLAGDLAAAVGDEPGLVAERLVELFAVADHDHAAAEVPDRVRQGAQRVAVQVIRGLVHDEEMGPVPHGRREHELHFLASRQPADAAIGPELLRQLELVQVRL